MKLRDFATCNLLTNMYIDRNAVDISSPMKLGNVTAIKLENVKYVENNNDLELILQNYDSSYIKNFESNQINCEHFQVTGIVFLQIYCFIFS